MGLNGEKSGFPKYLTRRIKEFAIKQFKKSKT